MLRLLLAVALCQGALAQQAEACTTFCATGGPSVLFGKSYDWHIEDGALFVNKRQVRKKALVLAGTPAEWTSRYGSLSFNQYGREFPNGGMNETGLAVEIMWLASSQYPAPGGKGRWVNELQWIQYQLDTASSLREAIANARSLKVSPIGGRVHYLVCDRHRQCGAFEYIDGNLEITQGKKLEPKALTNDTYRASSAYLRTLRGKASPLSVSSLDRFVRASRVGQRSRTTRQAFAALNRVKNGTYTKWQIVYDLSKKIVYWRTLSTPKTRHAAIAAFDYSCKSPSRMLPLLSEHTGDVTGDFVPYSRNSNLKLIRSSLSQTQGVPQMIAPAVADYPSQQTQCQTP